MHLLFLDQFFFLSWLCVILLALFFFKHLNQYEKGCFKYFVTFAISLNIIVE